MNENNYETYKRNLFRGEKLREGKLCIFVGICLLLYTLYTLPFHATNVSDIQGNQLQAGKAYYIENLKILHAKMDDTNDQIYCIATFLDQNQNAWFLSFTPNNDKYLTERIHLSIALGKELNLEISGYFYLDDITKKAGIYYSSLCDEYTDSDGTNVLNLNANYLCGASDNYTLQALLRPGYTRAGFVWSTSGILWGVFLIVKNRIR